MNNSKIFPKLSVVHEKKKEKLFLGELWEEKEWGVKKATTCPIFHNSYPVFGDFLISVAGVGPIPQQGKEKRCRGPAQVPQAQGGPASPHPAQTAGQDTQTVTCGGSGWMSVPTHELGGIKATVPSKDNLSF